MSRIKSGEVVSSEIISEGQRGRDLVLTIDMDLQRAVEKIIEEELRSAKSYAGIQDYWIVRMLC